MNEFRQLILRQALTLRYNVKSEAPSDLASVLSQGQLTVWSGQSENTIWGDASVNYAFRALHDRLHQVTLLDFTPEHEIELGRIQANQYDGMLADLVYCEVAMQAKHYLETGSFVNDQIEFTINYLKSLGYNMKGLF